jgi:hypothetical protein
MTDNLDVVLSSLESLAKAIDATRNEMVEALIAQVNCSPTPMKFVAESKFQETIDSVTTTRAANKQLTEVSKRLVKENILLTKEVKSLRDKVAGHEKELSDLKNRESSI